MGDLELDLFLNLGGHEAIVGAWHKRLYIYFGASEATIFSKANDYRAKFIIHIPDRHVEWIRSTIPHRKDGSGASSVEAARPGCESDLEFHHEAHEEHEVFLIWSLVTGLPAVALRVGGSLVT